MADYKLGVDQSSNYKLYTGDGITEIGTISGLADGLVTDENPVDAASKGVTVTGTTGSYTVTLGNAALPDSPTAGTTTISATGCTLKLDDSDTDITKYGATLGTPELKYVHSSDTNSSSVNVVQSLSAGWGVDETEGTITYKAEGSQTLAIVAGVPSTSGTVTVSGTDANVKLVGDDNKKIEFAQSALGESMTLTNVVADSGYTLKLADGIVSTKTADGYEITVSNGTASAKAKWAEYWELSETDTKITYHAADTETSAAIQVTGLADDANASNVIFDTDAKTVTLKESALQADTSKTVSLTGSGSNDYTFVLNNVTAPGTKTAGSTIALDIDDINTDEATVVQTFQAGWELGTNSKSVTYKAAVPVTLATITGLATGATASDITLSGKTITLKQGALTQETDADKFITLTPTEIETLNGDTSDYKDYGYVAADVAYGLALATGVVQTPEFNKTYVTAVTADDPEDTSETATATATVTKEMKEYWTADKAAETDTLNTVITYHPQGAGTGANDTIAKVTGLVAAAAEENSTDVTFDTSAKTITLTEGALIASTTNTVTLDTTNDKATNKYTLVLSEVQAPGEDDEDPFVNDDDIKSGTVTVEQKLKAGWTLSGNTVTYSTPENDVLATITITNAAAGAESGGVFTLDGTTVKVGDGALDSSKGTTVTIANKTGYNYELALGEGVTEYGATTPESPSVEITGETDAPKTAKVQLTESAGWKCDATDGIRYGAAHDVVFATITNLSKDASEATEGSNISLGTDSETNKLTVVLKRDALTTTAENPTTLVNNAKLKDEANYETYKNFVYSLAFDDDMDDVDQDPGSQIVEENGNQVIAMALSEVAASGTTPATKTATITATLNEGWTLNDDGDTITYTAPAVGTTLATITGLNTDAVYEKDGSSNTVDFTNTAATGADTGVFTLTTAALTNANVVLTNARADVIAFTLKLQAKDENDNYEDVTEYGYAPTYAWVLGTAGSGTNKTATATYKLGAEQGWTVDADEQSETYGKRITYKAAVDAETGSESKILATITNLKNGITLGTYTYTEAGTEYTAPAVGTGTGADFIPGLYVTEEYDADTETEGTIYIAKNVLNADADKVATLADKTVANSGATGEYTFSLDDDVNGDNAEALYIPTTASERNIWAVKSVAAKSPNPKSTTATYKQVETEFWTLDGNTITYTPQKDKDNGTLATITGLADGITVQDVGAYGNKVSTLGKLENSVFTAVAAFGTDTTANQLTLDKGALTTMNVTLTNETDSGGDAYTLALNETGTDAKKVTAPVFGSYKWTTASVAASGTTPKTITATYNGNVTTAGYTLSADANAVKYTKTGSTTLATITGLDSSVVVNNTSNDNHLGTKVGTVFTQGVIVGSAFIGESPNTVEYPAFTLKDNVLGTTNVTLTSTDTDIGNYKLVLDDAVMDVTDPEITGNGVDAWRLDGTTATYRHLTPAYYTLDTENQTSITYTAEDAPESKILATITGLKAGLTLTDSNYEDGNNTLRTSVIEGITVTTDDDNKDVIKLTEAVLATNDGKEATLKNGTDSNYTLALDDEVDAVEINKSAAMSWAVESVAATQTAPATKTAILKGATTAGWTLDDTANTVTYTAAKTGQEFVTITGLNNSVNATKLKAMSAALPENGTFVLTEDLLTSSDVAITSGKLPNGKNIVYEIDDSGAEPVEVKYGIALNTALTEAADVAITGEGRWYLEDETTLKLATVHDAHYVAGKLKDTATTDANKLEEDSFEEDSSVITYIEEIKDDPDATISNLASGLKLNGKGAYTGSGAYYVVDDDDNDEPISGLRVIDYDLELGEKVLSKDTTKPTTLVSTNYDFTPVGVPEYSSTADPLKRFTINGTTAKLTEGKLEGYELDTSAKTITYHAEDFSTVLATVTGLKSGLTVGTDETDQSAIGSMQKVGNATTKTFVAGLTYDAVATKITLTTDVLDATAGKTVSISGTGGYTLALDDNVPTPEEGHGWKYTAGTGDNLATAEYKSGTQAGWAAGTGTDAGKKFTYQDAAYTGDTVATVKGLANNLKVSTDYQTITNSSGKTAVYEGTDTDEGKIFLTSYAFAKDNVTLKNAENEDYTLALYQGTTTSGTTTTQNDGYVENSVTTKKWAKAANANKATYTIETTEGYNIDEEDPDKDAGYDQRVIYTGYNKQVATLTGINSSLTVSADKDKLVSGSTDAITIANQTEKDNEGNDQTVEGKYVITVDAAALNKTKLTLAKTDAFILDFESTKPADPVWNKAKDSTKATYTQSYAADSYELAADKMSIAYTKDRVDTLFTLDGLAKDLVATSGAIAGVTVTTKDKPSTSSNVNADTEGEDETEKINVVELESRAVLNSGSTVKLTNGKIGTVTQDYRLWLGEDDTEDTTSFATGNYADSSDYGNKPLWTFDGKGTATLDEGTYEGWSYKENKDKSLDYTQLVYTKPTKIITATIKGLNSDLVVYDNAIYKKVSSGNPTVLAVSLDETKENTINLTAAALPATIKNNTKIALTLGKDKDGKVATYELANDEDNAITLTSNEDSVWSVNKGTASYQYGTTAGWTFSDAGDSVTYTDAKTTLVAKISGIKKDETTFTGAADAKGKATDVPVSVEDMEEHIQVVRTGSEEGKYTFTFTLKDADYLAGSKVTLTQADKKDGNTYIIVADESLAPYKFADGNAEHPAQWTVNGKNGSAKLTAGTSAGYSNLASTDKNYQKVINYSKEKTEVTYFTVSGLLKDKDKATSLPDLETQIVENEAITYDVTNQKVSLNNAAVLGTTNVSLTSGKKADKTAYAFTFDEDSLAAAENNDNIDIDKTVTLQAKGGTVNLVETAAANKFSLSTDGKKLTYYKKDTDTILATIKGLNKNLDVHDGKVVIATTTKSGSTSTTTYGTEELVTFDGEYGSGTFKLEAGALNDSNITLTVNNKIDGDYNIELADDILTSTDTDEWKNLTEWTFSNGTASYRNYDKGYYTASTKNKGGYDFTKETKGTTYATISGLNPDADAEELTAAFNDATNNYGGTITLDSSMLVTKDKNNAASGKNVTLKNSVSKDKETTFALALDTEGLVSAMVSTFKADGGVFTNGKLTGTYSTGYSLASDTSITYLAKEKGNQLIASITGVTGNVTAANDGTITLNANQLTGKSVTLTTTDLADLTGKDYKLSFSDTGRDITPADDTTDRTNGWEVKNGKATFTGYTTAGYKLADSEMSITYTKAVGNTEKAKPAVAMTITNVTSASGDSESVTVKGATDGKATTLSNGLIAVTFDGNNIAGSNESDTITLTTAASVKGGKGDDNITLSSGNDTILYGNGEGNDIVDGFSSSDKIILTSGKLTTVVEKDGDAVVKVGTGSITLKDAGTTTINIVDSKGESLWKTTPVESSSDILLADNNYSMDAAALSDIVEPFKASYTPYDFDAGLDLVKQNSLAPAVTFTGEDKK